MTNNPFYLFLVYILTTILTLKLQEMLGNSSST